MPNWVQNEIIFDNISDEKVASLIRVLRLETETDESAFDFDKLIPMPAELDIESSTRNGDAACLYLTAVNPDAPWYAKRTKIRRDKFNKLRNVIPRIMYAPKVEDLSALPVGKIEEILKYSDEERMLELGAQVCNNILKHGVPDWYEWRCRYWGTKWNAFEPAWSLDNKILIFQTAWSAPIPIVQAIAKKYPGLEFTHRWADEEFGSNCGQMWYSKGCGSDLEVEDYRALAMDIWGYTEDDFEE